MVADFTSVQLSDAGRDKVLIKGVKGKPRPDDLKVSMGYQNGWAGTCTIMYAWPDALKKAKKAEEIIRYQMKKIGIEPDEIYVEYVGINSLHGPAAVIPDEDTINEVGLRMTIRTIKREDAVRFPRLFPSLANSCVYTLNKIGLKKGNCHQYRELFAVAAKGADLPLLL